MKKQEVINFIMSIATVSLHQCNQTKNKHYEDHKTNGKKLPRSSQRGFKESN